MNIRHCILLMQWFVGTDMILLKIGKAINYRPLA